MCHCQRWNPRERPWPRGHILKSLASKVKSLAFAPKPQVLENWPVLGSRTALFFELLKFCGAPESFCEYLFFLRSPEKFFWKTFFLESTCGVYYLFVLLRHNWNDRCSRRVFLSFYSAVFQLTSAKSQTFAYNSRTVGSSYMKFGLQFEINELYVCTKFRGNRSRDFGFRTRKPARKVGVKSGISQKRLKYGKKYFVWL